MIKYIRLSPANVVVEITDELPITHPSLKEQYLKISGDPVVGAVYNKETNTFRLKKKPDVTTPLELKEASTAKLLGDKRVLAFAHVLADKLGLPRTEVLKDVEEEFKKLW